MINKLLPALPSALCSILLVACASTSSINPNSKAVELAPLDISVDEFALITAMKAKLPDQSFPVAVSYPYVITGNLSQSELVKWKSKIKATQDALKKLYFKDDPKSPIDVWLFKDAESYYHYNRNFWRFEPSTPYGYYLPSSRRMAMNIGSGSGTLIHELVHPYIVENFPSSPPWFNEGLASLYEKSNNQNGNIRGLSNWRLNVLRKMVNEKTMPDLSVVLGASRDEFYGVNREIYYAQARYIMYYLQQKGLLVRYYQMLSTSNEQDQTGTNTLLKVTGSSDLGSFQKKWLQYLNL